jgi:hypothetical protein
MFTEAEQHLAMTRGKSSSSDGRRPAFVVVLPHRVRRPAQQAAPGPGCYDYRRTLFRHS